MESSHPNQHIYTFKVRPMKLTKTKNQSNEKNLSWIWKTPCHPREIFFLQQSYVKGLPTNLRLHKAACTNSNLCPHCHLELETHLYILRDCNQSKTIWLSLHPSMDFFNKNYNDWLRSNSTINISGPLNIPWNIIFLYTLRALWLSRNNKVFLSLNLTSTHFIQQILFKSAEYWTSIPLCHPQNVSLPRFSK